MDQTVKKNSSEILEQVYVSADDLEILMPSASYKQRLALIKEIRNEMQEKKLFVPDGRTLLASTKILKKKCGI
ncbi:MAG: hypothetical protein SOZ06_03770 [Candidatus Faecenecus gallistercoris]|nr:hypothetical protein [Bacillota bacterium]MDY4051067.1 hypothetical protein [Candidatus Faecenecus gallistercoris]